MPLPFLHRERSLDELQEIADKREVEYTIEQRNAAIRELKKRGISPKSFGGNINSIFRWLKTH